MSYPFHWQVSFAQWADFVDETNHLIAETQNTNSEIERLRSVADELSRQLASMQEENTPEAADRSKKKVAAMQAQVDEYKQTPNAAAMLQGEQLLQDLTEKASALKDARYKLHLLIPDALAMNAAARAVRDATKNEIAKLVPGGTSPSGLSHERAQEVYVTEMERLEREGIDSLSAEAAASRQREAFKKQQEPPAPAPEVPEEPSPAPQKSWISRMFGRG